MKKLLKVSGIGCGGLIGIIIILSIISATIGGGKDDQSAPAASTAAQPSASTNTNASPAASPKPSLSQVPTSTPQPPPSPTPIPEPIVYQGSGDDVIKIKKPGGPNTPALVHIQGNKGAAYFGVTAYGAGGEGKQLLVNTTGAYVGIVPLDFTDRQNSDQLEIKAAGPWAIEIRDIHSARAAQVPGDISGDGDDVFAVDGKASQATITGNASAKYFGVTAYGRSPQLLVNTTARYEGRVRLNAGATLIEVKSVAPWTISLTP